MSLRREFVAQARQEGANISALCRSYGISRNTGYKWLKRYAGGGAQALADQSRQPHRSPRQTSAAGEALVVAAREAHPAWGGRKLKRWLEDQGHLHLPAPSTITAILRRRGLLDPAESSKHQAYQRFEMEAPNELWQMDFKGYFQMGNGHPCHPLTVLDDHSRFLVGLRACPNETRETVQQHLTDIFRTYGLPQRMVMDNGAPWGDDAPTAHTRLTVWLLLLGIAVTHGRPRHPQTQGKDERLHRTLGEELLARVVLDDLFATQRAFDTWRDEYNLDRPHDALALAPPVTRFQPSNRPFPATLPPLVYPADMLVRKVDVTGRISLRNRPVRIGPSRAIRSACRPTRWSTVCFRCSSARSRSVLSTCGALDGTLDVLPMSPNTCHPCPQSIHKAEGRAGDGGTKAECLTGCSWTRLRELLSQK